MSAASLQRSAVFSLVAHVTLFGIMLLLASHSNHFVMPSPYVVNLVGPDIRATHQEDVSKASVQGPAGQTRSEQAEPTKTERRESQVSQTAPKAVSRKEEQFLSDRIAALEAKKRIERIVRLRGVIPLRSGKGEGKTVSGTGPAVSGTGTGPAVSGRGSNIDDYGARVAEEIRRHWIFPETGDKGIEAIISVRIQKNGAVQILGIEKSSGNPLFDRSALRAITKASPVTRPLQEMEIGIRFYP